VSSTCALEIPFATAGRHTANFQERE